MAQSATEAIWHFIGYLRLPEYANTAPLHYSGGGEYRTGGAFDSRSKPAGPASEGDAGNNPVPGLGMLSSDGGFGSLLPRELASPGLSQGASVLRDATIAVPQGTYAFPPIEAGVGVAWPIIHATYGYGANPAAVVRSLQVNALTDDDVLTGDPALLAPSAAVEAHIEGAASSLAAMKALVELTLPAGLLAPVDDFGNIAFARTIVGDNEPDYAAGGADPEAIDDAENSTFVDGVKVTASGQSIEQQSATIEDILNSSRNFAGDTEEPTDPVLEITITNGREPTGGPAQIIATGDNEAINAVVLTDAGQAFGSLLVRGDYQVTNAIVQINVLQDRDEIDTSSTGIAQSLAASNTMRNEASFSADPGQLYGNLAGGGLPGALDWNIHYNFGDFYNLSLIEQHNRIGDNDIGEVTATNTHFTASLGENGQLNLMQMLDLGQQYDLIIIGGDYVKLNAIIQVNLVLDDDLIASMRAGTNGAAAINGGDNRLLNDAAIYSQGDQNLRAISTQAQQLADAIGNEQPAFSSEFALGLPGNGTPTFDVLYVVGNYYDYNIIYQTNTISDVDAIRLEGSAAEGEIAQIADAGGNSAINAALLVDVGSTSAYQYVGGDIFSDTLLVQANIITDEDADEDSEGTAPGEGAGLLHPDVVAAIAAMTDGGDTSQADTGTGTSASDAAQVSVQVDILANILS
jgi:hypothetical protein